MQPVIKKIFHGNSFLHPFLQKKFEARKKPVNKKVPAYQGKR